MKWYSRKQGVRRVYDLPKRVIFPILFQLFHGLYEGVPVPFLRISSIIGIPSYFKWEFINKALDTQFVEAASEPGSGSDSNFLSSPRLTQFAVGLV